MLYNFTGRRESAVHPSCGPLMELFHLRAPVSSGPFPESCLISSSLCYHLPPPNLSFFHMVNLHFYFLFSISLSFDSLFWRFSYFLAFMSSVPFLLSFAFFFFGSLLFFFLLFKHLPIIVSQLHHLFSLWKYYC